MKVTKHAEKRTRNRCGLPKKTVEKNAAIALEKGLTHSECTGSLRKYFDYLFLSRENGAGKIRIYTNYVYIFTNENLLITVIPLPQKYQKSVKDALNKRGETQ